MSNFITKNLIQCDLSELKLKSKNGFTFGGLTGNSYITANPGLFNLSSQGEVNISSIGQTTINGGISLNLVGSSNIQIGNTLNNPTQYIKLSGGKFEVKTSSGSLYLNDHFTYDGTYGSTQKLKLNITDSFAYSDITNNTTNYEFNINSNGLRFNSSQYNLQLTPVSFVVETSGTNRASINIGSSVFTVQSHNSATNYGTLYFSNNGFQAYYGKEVNNDVVLDYKLDVNSSALVYTGGGYLNINSSGFNINNTITALAGDVIIDIPTDKKVYYVHNNSEPTANDEIATVGTVSGYIPNAGNDIGDDFSLSRYSIALSGGGGISLWGCNSNISIDDFEDSNATIYINGLGRTIIFGNDGKIDLQGSVEITSGTNYDETPCDIKLNSAKDIILNAAENQKIYYVHNSAEPADNDEIVTKGDLANIDLSNYVLKTDFDQLLTAYNDLADRLNKFLEETGEIEPEINDYIVTKSLNNISFSIVSQRANDDYTIDWGDGNTSLSGDGTLSHNYSEIDSYTIKIIPNNDDADGRLAELRDLITEINVSNIDCANITEDDTIEKITVNNMIMQSGSWYSAFALELGALEELHIKDNCRLSYENPVVENCPNLTKITIDSKITNLSQNLVMDCPNVEELHLTSTVIPTFIDTNYSLFDNIPQNLTIYVPNDLVNDYKTALPDYVNYIVGE